MKNTFSWVAPIVVASIGLLGCASESFAPQQGMTPISDTEGCQHTVFGEAAVWSVLVRRSFSIDRYSAVRIDPQVGGAVAARIPLPPSRHNPLALAAGEGAVWVAYQGYPPNIYKLDPESGRMLSTIPVEAPGFTRPFARLTTGGGTVWAIFSGAKGIFRLDPRTDAVKFIPLGMEPTDVFAGADALWVLRREEKLISRIDLDTNAVVASIALPSSYTFPPGGSARHMAAADDSIWVLLGRTAFFEGMVPSAVGRIDPKSNSFIATIDTESILTDIDANSASGIWAAASDLDHPKRVVHHSVVEIDTMTNKVKRDIPLGSRTGIAGAGPKLLAVDGKSVWTCAGDYGIYHFLL
jgi:hypothetical protein